MRRAPGAQQFGHVVRRDVVEQVVGERLEELDGALIRATALDEPAGGTARGGVGVPRDEPRQQQLAGGVDAGDGAGDASFADLDDLVVAHADGGVLDELRRPVAVHEGGGGFDDVVAGTRRANGAGRLRLALCRGQPEEGEGAEGAAGEQVAAG